MGPRRIGVFGGTFDPPHVGHLIVASESFEALRLDQLLFIPAADPPHKGAAAVRASPEQRLRMLRAATATDPRFAVDDLELRRPGPSFTVDTLRALRTRESDAELILLLGIDQFRVLDSWRSPDEIVSLAQLAILDRGGETPDSGGPYGGVHLSVTRIDVSSTLIRRRAAAGLDVRHYVPDEVFELMIAEGIYGAVSGA